VGVVSYRLSRPDVPARTEEPPMPRYLVERNFSDGLDISMTPKGSETVAIVVATNADLGVTWLHSYVSADRRKTYCVYDGPSPESVRRVAQQNQLPVRGIPEVPVLDPYFYLGANGGV